MLAAKMVRGGKRLVAYVVVPTEVRPTVADLRGFLQGKLPEYMVPATFVFLEALPLDTQRQARPQGSAAAPDRQPAAQGYLALRTEAEEAAGQHLGGGAGPGAAWACRTTSSSWAATPSWPSRWWRAPGESGLRWARALLFQHQTVAELAQAASLERPGAGRARPRHRRPRPPDAHPAASSLIRTLPNPTTSAWPCCLLRSVPLWPLALLGQALNHLARTATPCGCGFTRRALQGWGAVPR